MAVPTAVEVGEQRPSARGGEGQAAGPAHVSPRGTGCPGGGPRLPDRRRRIPRGAVEELHQAKARRVQRDVQDPAPRRI